MRPLPQKTIGLLGGCSNVATVEYYKRINAEVNRRLGGWDIAETLIAGMNFGDVEALLRADDWETLTRLVDKHVRRLVVSGADVILCASNTLHRALDEIMAGEPTPMIHIADPTGAAIQAQGLRRIALFGTAPVMSQPYLRQRYASRFGLDILVPGEAEQAEIHRIIFEELVKDDVRAESRATYLEILDRMVREDGAEGVILGCTEIFLLLRPEDRPGLPMFDTTALHCRAAVDFALGEEAR